MIPWDKWDSLKINPWKLIVYPEFQWCALRPRSSWLLAYVHGLFLVSYGRKVRVPCCVLKLLFFWKGHTSPDNEKVWIHLAKRGMCCGYLLMPFWTFFIATALGSWCTIFQSEPAWLLMVRSFETSCDVWELILLNHLMIIFEWFRQQTKMINRRLQGDAIELWETGELQQERAWWKWTVKQHLGISAVFSGKPRLFAVLLQFNMVCFTLWGSHICREPQGFIFASFGGVLRLSLWTSSVRLPLRRWRPVSFFLGHRRFGKKKLRFPSDHNKSGLFFLRLGHLMFFSVLFDRCFLHFHDV